MALIELKEVSKIYGFGEATTLALDEVDLSVEKGEFVAVMGPSGCGKTTLMNMIGLLDRPTHGTYMLDGRHTSRLRANQQAKLRRDRIGFVFQSYNLLPRLNVLDNVALPLAYKGVAPVRRAKKASDILELVGMRDREYFYPRQLSGGQAQRASIARALINNPSIIIADEPTGNLDSTDSRVVMELLAEIHRQGNTVLLVTHNPELTRYANRILYMHDGMIIGDEKTEIGTLAKGVRRRYYQRSRLSDEDIAAGVSALLKKIPGKEVTGKVSRRKTKNKTVKAKRRKKAMRR
ncbi:ABC transporter ATP-binding protein [Candidatus Saccharibacteria bacterium]|jgi:putative ABC transport system ATP-binding protein|nr:ABC transporter ATP-binding protein [Candidatus Saccharibacteria bacterium]